MRIRRGVGIVSVGSSRWRSPGLPPGRRLGGAQGASWKASVPFTETVFDSATAESVTLTGTEALTLHVTGNVITGWNASLKATLHKSSGIGGTSGGKYKAKGSTTLTATFHPGPPTTPTTYQASFTLVPAAGRMPKGLSAEAQFSFLRPSP